MELNDTTRYRFLGTTDECIECQRCGKADLRSTVVLAILDIDGNIEDTTYYGSTCAARALGRTGRGASVKLLAEARKADWETRNNADDAHRMLAHYGLPETGEPTRAQIREAMQRYIVAHPNIHRWVQETGIGVRARVLDMLTRKRTALADYDALTVAKAAA